MAVNQPGQTTASASAEQAAYSTTGAAAAGQQQFRTREEASTGFGGMTPRFGISSQFSASGNGGDFFEKLYGKIQLRVKQMTEAGGLEEKYNVIKLLKNIDGLNYSGIIVAESLHGVTTAHVLLVERTGEYPDKLVENIQGVRYEMIRTPGDALDDKYMMAVRNAVAAVVKTDPEGIVVVDGTLVPNEFDLDSDAQVSDLINNTFNATHAELYTRVADYRGKDLSQLTRDFKNGKFTVTLSFNGDDTTYFNQAGMPTRQDICVSLAYKVNSNKQNRSVNQGDDSIQIVKTYGYIDFEFIGAQMVNNMMTSQKFIPNFVITHIESGVAPTPDIVMLGVASVLSLSDDGYWLQAFRPSVSKKNEFDFNDVGALNVEGNIEASPTGYGKRYDTKSKTSTPMEITKLIQTLVRPNMMISMDLPKAGPETWYTAAFRYIKNGTNPSALRRVNDFLNYATGGAYGGSDAPMFLTTSNKIHGGFYKTNNGFRDLRHLTSYLAVANYVTDTSQPQALLTQYTNTLYNNVIPNDLRAATRFQYINDMSKQTAVVKQMYDRVTFNGAMLSTWVRALHSIGFMPVFGTTSGDSANEMFMKRSTLDFQSGIIGGDVRFMGSADNMYGNWMPFGQYNRNF